MFVDEVVEFATDTLELLKFSSGNALEDTLGG